MSRLDDIKAALDREPVPCPYCKGKGEVYVEGSVLDHVRPEYRPCSHCDGTGVDPYNRYTDDEGVEADVRWLVGEVERLTAENEQLRAGNEEWRKAFTSRGYVR